MIRGVDEKTNYDVLWLFTGFLSCSNWTIMISTTVARCEKLLKSGHAWFDTVGPSSTITPVTGSRGAITPARLSTYDCNSPWLYDDHVQRMWSKIIASLGKGWRSRTNKLTHVRDQILSVTVPPFCILQNFATLAYSLSFF